MISLRVGASVVSTHSRPKAAGFLGLFLASRRAMFQHTAARRRLAPKRQRAYTRLKFQHTAARRRLVSFLQLS